MPLSDKERRAMFANGGRNKKETLRRIDKSIKKLELDMVIDKDLLKNLKETKIELKKRSSTVPI